jgi:hypothetical protein
MSDPELVIVNADSMKKIWDKYEIHFESVLFNSFEDAAKNLVYCSAFCL